MTTETAMSSVDVVREAHRAFSTGNRDLAETLYALGYTFTSPQDDHLDRATFFEKCFPTADLLGDQRIFNVQSFGADQVFAYYEYDGSDGSGRRYRNTEVHTVTDGQIARTLVFFGGAVNDSD